MHLSKYLMHSSKGTTWEKKDHKYVKKEDGKYYYNKDSSNLSEKEIEELAKKDPSELTDEELAMVYQFPDKVKENIEKEKDAALIKKGEAIVDRIINTSSELLKEAFKGFKL